MLRPDKFTFVREKVNTIEVEDKLCGHAAVLEVSISYPVNLVKVL